MMNIFKVSVIQIVLNKELKVFNRQMENILIIFTRYLPDIIIEDLQVLEEATLEVPM